MWSPAHSLLKDLQSLDSESNSLSIPPRSCSLHPASRDADLDVRCSQSPASSSNRLDHKSGLYFYYSPRRDLDPDHCPPGSDLDIQPLATSSSCWKGSPPPMPAKSHRPRAASTRLNPRSRSPRVTSSHLSPSSRIASTHSSRAASSHLSPRSHRPLADISPSSHRTHVASSHNKVQNHSPGHNFTVKSPQSLASFLTEQTSSRSCRVAQAESGHLRSHSRQSPGSSWAAQPPSTGSPSPVQSRSHKPHVVSKLPGCSSGTYTWQPANSISDPEHKPSSTHSRNHKSHAASKPHGGSLDPQPRANSLSTHPKHSENHMSHTLKPHGGSFYPQPRANSSGARSKHSESHKSRAALQKYESSSNPQPRTNSSSSPVHKPPLMPSRNPKFHAASKSHGVDRVDHKPPRLSRSHKSSAVSKPPGASSDIQPLAKSSGGPEHKPSPRPSRSPKSHVDLKHLRMGTQPLANSRNSSVHELSPIPSDATSRLHGHSPGNTSFSDRAVSSRISKPKSCASGSLKPADCWEKQKEKCELKEVCKGSAEWCEVKHRLNEPEFNVSIVRIERIQNQWQWEDYVHSRKRMSEKNGGTVNEKLLFHGSRTTPPIKIYNSEQGFDHRLAANGMWGEGSYFAVKASYSDKYAHHTPEGHRQMFLAHVLTGITCKCKHDHSMKLPPKKSELTPSGTKEPILSPRISSAMAKAEKFEDERYDSVCGVTKGSEVFVIYEHGRVYPAYLITYSYSAWCM